MSTPLEPETTVLFVDDEKEILEIFRELFSGLIPHVLTASSGAEALKLAPSRPLQLAVLDYNIGDMTGLELLTKLREIHPHTSSLIVSGFGAKENIQMALQMGVDDFIDKPINGDDLRTKILKTLEKNRLEASNRDILELFICEHTELSPRELGKMNAAEKQKIMKAALGLAKMGLENKRLSKKK